MNQPEKKRNLPQLYRGDVWRVQFPNRPNDPHLPRPAIIISTDKRNEHAGSVLCIPLTSKSRKMQLPTHVWIDKGTGGLDQDGTALCEQIADVSKECFVEGPIAKMPSVIMDALVRALKKAVE